MLMLKLIKVLIITHDCLLCFVKGDLEFLFPDSSVLPDIPEGFSTGKSQRQTTKQYPQKETFSCVLICVYCYMAVLLCVCVYVREGEFSVMYFQCFYFCIDSNNITYDLVFSARQHSSVGGSSMVHVLSAPLALSSLSGTYLVKPAVLPSAASESADQAGSFFSVSFAFFIFFPLFELTFCLPNLPECQALLFH